jgi:hypothetical protein
MSEYQEFRSRHYVKALKLTETENVFTTSGKEFAEAGDYLLKTADNLVYLVKEDAFDDMYELVPEGVSEARKFTAEGRTVEEVLNFFKSNPDEVSRVKALEAEGASRKGILDYEVR